MSSSLDPEMRHRAKHARVVRPRDADSLFRAADPVASPGVEPERADIDLDEVRLDLLQVDRHAGFLEPLGEPPRASVVVREPLDVVVERVDAGRGDDPAWRIAPPNWCL